VTQPIIPDEPARGTVDYYRSRLAASADVNDLHSRAIGLISAALADGSPEARVQRIENILAVGGEVTAGLLGLTYSRVDEDPQVIRPHSPRLPLHTGAVTDEGLVEMVSEFCCGHDFEGHNDLAGCAVVDCNCPESRATLLTPPACSPECAERPEEWPCLDSCPAQRAARGES
jgi:hypothetical protein